LTIGISAAKAGDKRRARRLLTQAVHHHPDSAEAWLWLGHALATPQGRIFCLRRALVLDPTNQLARRGLAALEKLPPAPVIVARPAQALIPEPPALPSQPPPLARAKLAPAGHLRRLWSQPRFWQAVVACLGVVALGLIGALIYDRPAADDSMTVSLAASDVTPRPQHTLRPTFTPRPTATPLPTTTPTGIPTVATPTPSPSATVTPTPTPTLTPTHRARSAAPALPTSTPRPTLPPRVWDPRLDSLGVRLEPAHVPPGVGYWRLVEARWADGEEAHGDHTIYVEVVSPAGARVVGQPVIFEWASDRLVLPVEDRPPPDWGVNFPMFATLGSYSARVGVEPSDRVIGMGMGTVDAPDFTIHTNFFLIFRWVY
jgi:Tetratricopeptide repeat